MNENYIKSTCPKCRATEICPNVYPPCQCVVPFKTETIKRSKVPTWIRVLHKDYDLVNLTPHAINIVGGVTIPPSGKIARVEMETETVDTVNGIPLTVSIVGLPVNLPEPSEGTLFIVSRMVAAAVPERGDLIFPGELERDENGRVIGCKTFSKNE